MPMPEVYVSYRCLSSQLREKVVNVDLSSGAGGNASVGNGSASRFRAIRRCSLTDKQVPFAKSDVTNPTANTMTLKLRNSTYRLLLIKLCVISASRAAFSTVYVSECNRTSAVHTDKRVIFDSDLLEANMQFRFRLDATSESFKRLVPRRSPTKANKFCRQVNFTARLEEISSSLRQRIRERCTHLELPVRRKRFLHGVLTVLTGTAHLTSIVWEAAVLSQELVHDEVQNIPQSSEDSNEAEEMTVCWLQLLAEAQLRHRLQERLKLVDDITAEGFISEGTSRTLLEAIVGYSRLPTAAVGMMLVTQLTHVLPRKCTANGDIYVDVLAKYVTPTHVGTLIKTVDYGRFSDDKTRFERFNSAWMLYNDSYYEIDPSKCGTENAIFLCKGPKLIVSSCILDVSVHNCHPIVYDASSDEFLLHDEREGKHVIATKIKTFWIESPRGRHRFSTPESGIFEVALPSGYALIVGTSVHEPKLTLNGTGDIVLRMTEVKWGPRRFRPSCQ